MILKIKGKKMKTIKILMIFLMIFSLNTAFGAHQLYADIDGVNIPYGTKLELSMANDVTTVQAASGDMFKAYLTKDLYVNNKLILPMNTIFRGRISDITYSKMLSRPAAITLTPDHLVSKNGTQVPLNAGLATGFQYILKNNGSLTTNGNYFKAVKKDAVKAGKIVPRTINWGKTSDDTLFKGAKFVFVPVAAISGGIACVGSTVYNTVADLFRHGDEIIIKKGSLFDILILSNLEIPNY